MYPDIRPDDISNIGEKIVAEALIEQCPSEWTVIYSKYWLKRDFRYNRNRFMEGEIDFIVIVPNKGLVYLEVKSATRYQLAPNGIWRRFDNDQNQWVDYHKSPWFQAQTNQHNLSNLLAQSLRQQELYCARAAMVVFPRATREGSLPAGEGTDFTVVDGKSLKNLRSTIEKLLDGWSTGRPANTRQIRDLLCPKGTEFRSCLALDAGEIQKKQIQLTANQARILQGLKDNRMIQVVGGAGTGKTVLAIELAKERSTQGERVLVVCYSRTLAQWISEQPDCQRFTVMSFHALTRKYADTAHVTWPAEPDTTFWAEGAAEVLLQAIERSGPDSKFDSVIIDEAQDFAPMWLIPLLELWTTSGRFAVFGDDNQALFGQALSGHSNFVRYRLSDNCRNTRQIGYLCDAILQHAGVSLDGDANRNLPLGPEPKIERFGDRSGRIHTAINVIQKWTGEGLSPAQIAVLSPWSDDDMRQEFAMEASNVGVKIANDLTDWRQGRGCLLTTIKSFKGLEAEGVIITDVTPFRTGFSELDAYVACSRARFGLSIVPTNQKSYSLFEMLAVSPEHHT